MKQLFFYLLFSISTFQIFGQITNVKTGLWSDQTAWSNNKIPTGNDDIVLSFDIIVDKNANCKSLTLNGHNVTVSAGVNFNVAGNSNANILSSYIVFDTTASAPLDTSYKIQFYYDSIKRNTSIDFVWYLNGLVSDQQYKSVFFYHANDTLPYMRILTTPAYQSTDDNFAIDTCFYFYSNTILVADSSIQISNLSTQTIADKYVYNSGGLIKISTDYFNGQNFTNYDTVYIQRTNGNITSQIEPYFYYHTLYFNFIYDNHPNPFKRTQYKIAVNNAYPFYYPETFIEEVFENNNALEINESQNIYESHLRTVYEYKANGYPKTVWYYDTSNSMNFGKGIYIYTN